MNRREVKRAPVLRFKGFTNDWEQRKLKKLGFFYKGKGYTKKDLINNGVPILLYGELYTHYSEKISNTRLHSKLLLHSIFSAGNEVVLPDSGETSTDIARASWISNSGIILAGGLIIIKPNEYIFPGFLAYSLTYGKNHKLLASRAQGKSIVHIHANDLKTLNIIYPENLKEQQRIFALLEKLNKCIALQQRKLELLSLIKKTIIKYLFKLKNSDSLNLKFKTSCSQWNSKKLGEIAKFINGRAFKQSELLNKGKYPVLRVGNFYTNDKWFYSDLNLNKNKYADKGDLLYTWSATFGPHIWKGPKVIFHYHIWKIDFDPSIVNKTFLFYFLEADKENLLTNSNGSTMIHITKSNMENKIINLPQFSIQQNIGTFLSNLDYLINQEKIKSKQLIQLKRFLLQNMFI